MDFETYFSLTKLIYKKDIPGILNLYNNVYINGYDDIDFLDGLSKHIRELLIHKLGSFDKLLNYKSKLGKKYIDHSNDISEESLISMIEIVNETLINYNKINDKRVHIELCLMKLASIDSKKKKL